MPTAPFWAMARLTCYHCHITCWLSQKIGFMQVVTPPNDGYRCGGLFFDRQNQNTLKTISEQIAVQPSRGKALSDFLKSHLSLKYKYKERARDLLKI
ncbi:hypothetical protein ACFME5_005094 [Escherichia coli]